VNISNLNSSNFTVVTATTTKDRRTERHTEWIQRHFVAVHYERGEYSTRPFRQTEPLRDLVAVMNGIWWKCKARKLYLCIISL